MHCAAVAAGVCAVQVRTRSARVRVAHAQVREVSDEFTASENGGYVMRWAPDAFRPLQEITEAWLVELFKKACVFHLANEEVTGCLPLTAWPLTAWPSLLAPHCWPLTAGPSLLAPHCWPLTAGPSLLALLAAKARLLRPVSYALAFTPWLIYVHVGRCAGSMLGGTPCSSRTSRQRGMCSDLQESDF